MPMHRIQMSEVKPARFFVICFFASAQVLMRQLESKDWVEVVAALTLARQIIAHHVATLAPHL